MTEPMSDERLAEIRAAIEWVDPREITDVVGYVTELLAEVDRLRAREQRVAEALLEARDDGNGAGLDGWIGPGRGEEPDAHGCYLRKRYQDQALAALNGPDPR